MSVTLANTTANLSGAELLKKDGTHTITGPLTFDRDPSAPFLVTSGSAVVTNLDADKVDGYEGAALAVLAENETVSGAWTFSGITTLTIPVTAAGNIYSSTYTPTVSATVNVAASTPNITGFVRIGNFVIVCGTINIDPTLAAPTETTWELDLPVASNLGAISDLGGTFVGVTATSNVHPAGAIRGHVANNTADFIFVAASDANQTLTFTFGYRVI